jgi:hypothetical protein
MCARRRLRSQIGGLLTMCGVFVSVGCSRTQTSEQALDTNLKTQGLTKQGVYPLAGKVTIDGQPPQTDKKTQLLVMLFDRSQPDLPLKQRPKTTVDSQGNFAFQTYAPADGIVPGKYVVAFALLTYNRKRGYLGPDKLKNQYNDPDHNAGIPEFNIDHQPPGKKDYAFDLKIPSGDGPSPGPKALTGIPDR